MTCDSSQDDGAGQPLLLPLTEGDWGPGEYDAVGPLFGQPGEDVPRAGSCHARDPLNFDIIGVRARHPKMARVFLAYNAFLLQRGELPLRLRELAVLRLAHARRSAFFWGEHVGVATAQAMELIFVVGTYSMLAMACDTWALAPPPGT